LYTGQRKRIKDCETAKFAAINNCFICEGIAVFWDAVIMQNFVI
jgi:hypothetical protein